MKRPFSKIQFILFLIISFATGVWAQSGEIAFVKVNVLNMESEEILKKTNGHCQRGAHSPNWFVQNGKTLQNARKIKGKGKYLMPGISEMHAAYIPVPKQGDESGSYYFIIPKDE